MKTRLIAVLVPLVFAGCVSAPRTKIVKQPISAEARTAIERAVADMRDATRDIVFPPSPSQKNAEHRSN